MKIARIILSWIGIALIVVLVVAIGLFAAIQTSAGKRMLADFAGRMASSNGLTVTIEGLSGFIPTTMGVERVTLADSEGVFGEVDGLALAWHPLALLSGTIDVERLGADRVSLARRPVLPAAAPDTSTSTSGSGIPMLRVILGSLDIGEIALGEPVLGMPATLGLQASAQLVDPAQGLALNFAVLRKDAPGEIKGRVRFIPDPGQDSGKDTLVLDVTASEPEGGLVARLAAIEGLPPLSLSIKGSAPLDDWNGKLVLDAANAGRIEGTGAVRRVENGRRIMLDLGGAVAGLVPASVRPLFDDHTTVVGSAVVQDDRKVAIEGLNLSAAGFGLALVGSLDTEAKTADITFDLVGGDPARFASFAPGITWSGWRLNAAISGAFVAPAVNATLTAQGLSGKGYGAQNLNVVAKTTPQAGGLAFTVDGTASGLSASDPKVAAALGQSGTFSAAGSTGANGPALTRATIALTPVDLAFEGTATPKSVAGALHLNRLDLIAFSALAGRPLSGTVALEGTVDTGADFAKVALDVNGTADKVATGIPTVDGFFAGRSTIRGAVARSADGSITVNGLTLVASGLDLTVNGGIQQATADLTAKLKLANLNRLDPRVSGGANAELRFSGGLDALGLAGTIDIASAKAMDKTIENLHLAVDLADLTGKPSGSVKLDGRIAGKPATGSARFAVGGTGQRVDDLDFTIGSVRAQGAAGIGANGIVDGRFTVAAGNLADLSALILTDIRGRLDTTIVLDAVNGVQRVAVNGRAQDIVFAGNRLDRADIDARVVNPAGVPRIDGKVTLAGVTAGDQRIENAVITAKSAGTATDVTLDTALLGASINARANIAPAGSDMRIRLDQFRAAKGPTTITLSSPANLTLSGSSVAIDRLALTTSGNGNVTVSGRAGQTLDLTVDIRALPLALASLAAPTLDLRGTLSGNARLSGPATAPNGTYQLNIAKLSNAAIANQGAGPFDIAANGTLGGGQVRVDATINGPRLEGLTVRGSVPIAAGTMDVRIAGAIDLAIANTALATSGSTVRGKATIDATLRGTAAAPAVSGTVRVAGATFIDSVNGVTLTNIQAVLTGTDRAIQVTTLTAQTPNAGQISGSGNIALDPARGFPASIQINMQRATLLSSDLVRLIADGRLTIDGPVTTRPKIAGRIDVRNLDINIADKLPGGLDPLTVRHVNTRGAQQSAQAGLRAASQARAKAGARGRATPAFVADLDLAIAAANGVFVRGMGIDAEFGGELTVRGTTAAPVTLGGFELRRGRFDVLGRRLDFTEGRVAFEGNTDPALNFTATTTSNEVTANIIVSGRASAPEVSFSSSPTLPEDEVLSRILFGRSVSTLNTSQALQVAQAIAQFSGGGPGVLDSVRRSLGVDSLDVDTSGNVGIGKRLNDRIYIGAKQGPTAASGKVTVDVDVTRNIRLQGAAGADGSNELGLGAQWDY
ncbi:translocation/assembly module TamB domain-containing protein [Kaistia dalseonensis]|uniref:Translocation and assembly module TamB n=1 Tax=Kaistia dalseonensis TaxID=410840 RepID=A0ABU0HCI7_9HYPH|nr:translocation/assembly module TamB domain-containing protein [Kaistia dalseonensis]MCX5497388.1 translocation/assembly module TamB domain-containing protein [Kaistia dalseonensis]MDQ0440027.1 translocation and assembly module TamB [Kaistia dalseonensis]